MYNDIRMKLGLMKSSNGGYFIGYEAYSKASNKVNLDILVKGFTCEVVSLLTVINVKP